MRRPFLVEEIMLSNAAGEVRGQVHVDRHSSTIEKIVCQEYRFRSITADQPITLSPSERILATEIISRTLNADPDLAFGVGAVIVSGNAHSPPTSASKGQQVLAEYLQSPRESQSVVTHQKADKDEPAPAPSAFRRIARSG